MYFQTQIEINEILGSLVELELIGVIQSFEEQRYQLDEVLLSNVVYKIFKRHVFLPLVRQQILHL